MGGCGWQGAAAGREERKGCLKAPFMQRQWGNACTVPGQRGVEKQLPTPGMCWDDGEAKRSGLMAGGSGVSAHAAWERARTPYTQEIRGTITPPLTAGEGERAVRHERRVLTTAGARQARARPPPPPPPPPTHPTPPTHPPTHTPPHPARRRLQHCLAHAVAQAVSVGRHPILMRMPRQRAHYCASISSQQLRRGRRDSMVRHASHASTAAWLAGRPLHPLPPQACVYGRGHSSERLSTAVQPRGGQRDGRTHLQHLVVVPEQAGGRAGVGVEAEVASGEHALPRRRRLPQLALQPGQLRRRQAASELDKPARRAHARAASVYAIAAGQSSQEKAGVGGPAPCRAPR